MTTKPLSGRAAIAALPRHRPVIVDLNCGCPVPKITKSGGGIALMLDEVLFGRCIEAMAKAVKVPVTVKMRLGFNKEDRLSPRFARVARESGAQAVSVRISNVAGTRPLGSLNRSE